MLRTNKKKTVQNTAKGGFANESYEDAQPAGTACAVSALLHIFVFAVMIFFPGFSWNSGDKMRNVISVDMMSIPAAAVEEDSEPGPAETPVKKDVPKPVVEKEEPEPELEKEVPKEEPKKETVKVEPEKPVPDKKLKIKKKKSLKKATFSPEKAIKKAVDDIKKKKRAEAKSKRLAEAIRNIKKRLVKSNAGGRKRGAAGGRSPDSGKILGALAVYHAEITYYIQKNWAFPRQLAEANADLKTILVVTIVRSGDVKSISFEKRSGNPHLDESAQRAIMKANPLPPLPLTFKGNRYTVGIIFTPKGIHREG